MQFDNRLIGEAIRRKRIQKGMTQEILSSFAEIVRTHLTMIKKWQQAA